MTRPQIQAVPPCQRLATTAMTPLLAAATMIDCSEEMETMCSQNNWMTRGFGNDTLSGGNGNDSSGDLRTTQHV